MAIETLKGLKRKAIRVDLAKQGYLVYNHHYSKYDTDRLLHIAMNRLAKETNQDFYQLFIRVCVELNRLKAHVRVETDDWKGMIVNERRVCLNHSELASELTSPTNTTQPPAQD